jgi:hypothetical protein
MAASCPTASKCYVVGSLFTPSAHQLAYVASFVGGRWTSQFFYLGRGESSTEMQGLSCNAAACWVIGSAWSNNWVDGFAYPLVRLSH